jgi:hypothetical protein
MEAISGASVRIRAHLAGEYVRRARTTTRHAIAHDGGEALREASVAASSTATNAAATVAASASASPSAPVTLVVGGCELEEAHLMKVIRNCV